MFQFLFKQFLLLLGNIGDFFELIFQGAFRRVQDEDGTVKQRFWLVRLLVFPFLFLRWLLVSVLGGLLFPFRRVRTMSAESLRLLTAGIPAVVAMLTVIIIAGVWLYRSGSIESKYRQRMRTAMDSGNFPLAKMFCNRLISDADTPSNQLLLTYAEVLGKTGEGDRAETIINQLAPDDRIGDRYAHRLRAIQIANSANAANDPELLKKLRWHLMNVDSNTAEVNQIWSMYYMAVGQDENAIRYMEAAAQQNPALHLSVADLYSRLGNVAGTQRALRNAEEAFSAVVKKDPLDTAANILLASTYIRLERFDDAERVLSNAIRLQPVSDLKRALSEFYVLQHDRAVENSLAVSTQLKYLQQALNVDENFLAIYERLVRQYRNKSVDDAAVVKEMLTTAIASGEATALAHFALSNVLMIDGDTENADWHLQQAYRIDNKFAVIANNMAWILAHRDPPELDQAHEIIQTVIEQVPDNSQFRDTLATILMKQGKLNEAIVEFERALPGLRDASDAHRSLAQIYRQLGRDQIADQHEALAGAAKP